MTTTTTTQLQRKGFDEGMEDNMVREIGRTSSYISPTDTYGKEGTRQYGMGVMTRMEQHRDDVTHLTMRAGWATTITTITMR